MVTFGIHGRLGGDRAPFKRTTSLAAHNESNTACPWRFDSRLAGASLGLARALVGSVDTNLCGIV